jgi:hypothetical protein
MTTGSQVTIGKNTQKKNIQIYANASLRRLRQKELNPKAELGN